MPSWNAEGSFTSTVTLSPLFSDTAGGFLRIESTRTTIVCADFGTSANEVAPSWLTVPEKTMLDCFISAAWLLASCESAPRADPNSASHKVAPTNNDETFMCASFPPLWRACASRDHRNAKIEWIDGNRHRVACPIVEGLGGKVRGPLVRYALREIGEIRCIVGAENATELIPHRKQVVVVS